MTLTVNGFLALAWLSVTDPREVARRIIALDLPRDVLWPGLALVVACNAILFALGNIVSPPQGPVPGFLASPFMFAVFLFCGLVVTIFGLHWTGRMFGGAGRLTDMIALMTWLQALRLLVQLGMLVLVPLSPALAGLILIGVAVLGLYILMHFVNEAHGFGNLFKAFGVIVFSVLAVAMGLSMILAVIGVGAEGMVGNNV